MRPMEDNHTTPGERLGALIKRSSYDSVRHFASVAGKSVDLLRKQIRDERTISAASARTYGRLLGRPPEEILYGKRFNQDYEKQPIIAVAGIAPSLVPLLSYADVEQFTLIASGAIPMSDNKISSPFDPLSAKRIFAVEMPDKSMESDERESIAQGDRLFINPEEEYKTGNIVVAMAPGFVGLIVRKYRIKSFDADAKPVFELVPLNSDFPAVLGEQALQAQIIGRVIGVFRSF